VKGILGATNHKVLDLLNKVRKFLQEVWGISRNTQ
jgi:hypothetical protein